jgi:cell division protein FtsN
MADDNNAQNRLNNMSDRGAQSGGQGNDPLAELARLIGQNDPYSEFGRDTRATAPAPQRPIPSERPLAGQPYAEGRVQADPAGAYHMEPEPPAFIQAGRDANGYRESAYRDANQSSPGNDFYYDESEPSGRGRGFKTAIAVIVLAVVGTAGAFGYRFIFSGSGSSAPPPVIRANPEPTKVPPPVASGDSSQSKATYDRVGDRGQGERVVSREEPPVDAKDLRRPGVGLNPPPPASSTNQWTTAVAPNLPPSASTSPVAAPPTMAMGEPKRVRTVPIRPEPTETNMGPPPLMAPGGAAPNANTPNARSAPVMPNAPQTINQPRRQTVSSPPPTQAPTNAPLALNDDSSLSLPRSLNAAPQPRPAPAQRSAPAPVTAPRQPLQAPQAPQAPTQLAAATPGGGYLVQVSSQRNETEAQAALRSLQAKYSNVLGGQQASVRRADLGARGVFYRAMIGPFASRDQANQICGNLKAAGGDCIVQGN